MLFNLYTSNDIASLFFFMPILNGIYSVRTSLKLQKQLKFANIFMVIYIQDVKHRLNTSFALSFSSSFNTFND